MEILMFLIKKNFLLKKHMNSRFAIRKNKLIGKFNKKFSKIINGGTVCKFIDASNFNPDTFLGEEYVSPPNETSRLVIPVININGAFIPVPIVVRPPKYNNFISFLREIITASSYYRYTMNILESVNARLSIIKISSPRIKRLPSLSSSPRIKRLPSLSSSQKNSSRRAFL
jgi:hypothetical protein